MAFPSELGYSLSSFHGPEKTHAQSLLPGGQLQTLEMFGCNMNSLLLPIIQLCLVLLSIPLP